jgi:exosortase H (IPTLxxWG-CTERM-specific)
MKSRRGRFLLVFFVLLVLFEVPLLIPAVDRTLVRPFTQGIASVSGVVLNGMGQNVAVSGTTLRSSCFSVNINNGCNGLEATLFLVAAVLAFPATARARTTAAVLGVVLIQVMNLVRVATLFLAGCYRREWFDFMHLTLWQTVIFAIAIFYFAAWTRRVSNVPQRA